jgi:hypothetical protein
MRAPFFVLTPILALSIPLLFAKGTTVRIVISGGDLAEPVEITDPKVAACFHVWSGRGTSSGEPQSFIIDWLKGKAEAPKGHPVYQVSFVTTRLDRTTYVVSYVVDPSTKQGYVYLPGKADPGYEDNVWLIYRGVEGNWFHAWSEWEGTAHPLIAKARKTSFPATP